jgi:hypothetical protein
MRRTSSLVLAALLTGALAVAGTGSATAKPLPNHATVKDKAGDAPAGIDLLQATYTVSKKTATFSVKVKELTDTTFIAFEIWPLAAGWDRIAIYRENGKLVHKLYYVDNEEETTPYLNGCKKLKTTWSFAADVVTASVPISCLLASRSGGANPFEFHTFSRFGGQKSGPRDAMPAKKLDY